MFKVIRNFVICIIFIHILIIIKSNIINIPILDFLCFMADNGKDINLHGHISVTTEAGKAIGQGLQTIGTQLGLGATAVGFATAVSKVVAKSGMPPLQKVGAVVGSGIIGGLLHSNLSIINNNKIIKDNIKDSINSASSSSRFNGDDLISSPLEDLL